VRVVEADPSMLHLEHQWGFVGDLVVPAGQSASKTIFVNEGGRVGASGAQLTLVFSATDANVWTITLTAPDGSSKTWTTALSTLPVKLYWVPPAFSAATGIRCLGKWMLQITNPSGSPNTLYSGSTLFVEGVTDWNYVGVCSDEKAYQETGAAYYDWGVYADPVHMGESGVAADLAAARALIRKMAQSHTTANLIQSLAPYPDVATGANAAVPDECIPA
jgi:hypothetical protein